MDTRRGRVFFWIVQILLLPTLVCFVVTLTMRFSGRSLVLWKTGVVTGLVQIPFTSLAFVFALATGMGDLLPKTRIRGMYVEIAVAALMITSVLLWSGVDRW